MKKGTTLKGEIAKLQGAPKQYKQGWTEFYEQSSRTHKPIQYERGYCEFYKLKFFLTPDVLIPRPETELLVDSVLQIADGILSKNINHKPSAISVLDIGTGSGCIAISIAKNLKDVKVIAIDISEKALEVAKKNAKFHRVGDQIFFFESDLLSVISSVSEKSQDLNLEIATSPSAPRNDNRAPDVIVANLPYIPSARLMLIDPMVADFEPKLALDGGLDGFEIYRTLFKQMKEKNFFPKYFIAEIDEEQKETALAEAKQYFPNAISEVKKDLAKKDRILRIEF